MDYEAEKEPPSSLQIEIVFLANILFSGPLLDRASGRRHVSRSTSAIGERRALSPRYEEHRRTFISGSNTHFTRYSRESCSTTIPCASLGKLLTELVLQSALEQPPDRHLRVLRPKL